MMSLDEHAMRIEVSQIFGVAREEQPCVPRRKSTFRG